MAAPRRVLLASAAAGAAAVAALLVKQNMADVGVFAATAVLLAWRRHEVEGRQALRVVAGAAVGALLCLGVAAAWTVLHGTSLSGVFAATYPFRFRAGRVIAASAHPAATARFWALLGAWVLSGVALVLLVVARALVSRRLRGTAAWALVATAAFDLCSVVAGGSYWKHYLVELVVPVAVLAGLLVARRQPGARGLVAVMALTSLVAWVVVTPGETRSVGSTVGRSVAAVARPHDTIVTVYGHADVTEASGLASPYPYLWSLPVKTLDPRLQRLDAVLRGRSAPTWLVTWGSVSSWGVSSVTTSRLVARRYHPVGRVLGRTVYLRDGLRRQAPS